MRTIHLANILHVLPFLFNYDHTSYYSITSWYAYIITIVSLIIFMKWQLHFSTCSNRKIIGFYVTEWERLATIVYLYHCVHSGMITPTSVNGRDSVTLFWSPCSDAHRPPFGSTWPRNRRSAAGSRWWARHPRTWTCRRDFSSGRCPASGRSTSPRDSCSYRPDPLCNAGCWYLRIFENEI